MLKKIMTLIILGTLFSINSTAAREITLGYVEFPPYEYCENGNPVGIQVGIVKELCKRAGISIKLQFMPFKRALEDTKRGRIDGLFNFYKIKERLPFFDYTNPVIENPLVFFVKKDSQLTYNSLEDLKGLKVGVMHGYTYGTGFDQSSLFTRESANHHASNFNKLVRGRINIYPCDKLVGIYVARKNNLMSNLKTLPVPLKVMDGHIGFTKGKHLDIISKINAELEIMKQNNEIKNIIDQYISQTQ
jgi:polar amino acid transport system substrate-binding protein